MRELGAVSVSAYGVSVLFPQVSDTQRAQMQEFEDAAYGQAQDDDEDDGIPLAQATASEAWLAQKAKQDAAKNSDASPQVDLHQWYTARPLQSVY